MNFDTYNTPILENIEIRNLLSENGKADIIEEIVEGLSSSRPYISSKFFYDGMGSKLFEQITELDEYYPSRVEKEIIRKNAFQLLNNYSNKNIFELGSGDCSKISLILEAIPSDKINEYTYIPVDVSRTAIMESAGLIVERFKNISVKGQVLDFTTQFGSLPHKSASIICFFGSTIGNFNPEESYELMRNISSSMSRDDILLVGFDMVKDIGIIESAYNDSLGTTDKFNKNILNVVNSIIDSNFDIADFEHVAFYNAEESRIEMHLEARRNIIVHSPYFSRDISILEGERIHTENSYKYTSAMIEDLARAAELRVRNDYSNEDSWFSLIEFIRDDS